MRHGGVRRFADWFRTSSTPEEKTPFANKLANNGSIGPPMDNRKRRVYDKSVEDCEEKPKMGILRKLLFFLSLNGGVAYVAVLLWAIPCRDTLCMQQQQDWQQYVPALLTSNMETPKLSGKPYSVVFGYSDENGGHLASLAISDGKMMWNQSTSEHYLRHVFCQFDRPLQLNKRQLCIATALNYIAAFDVTNGEVVWHQNLSNPYSETIHKISLSKDSSGDVTYALGVSDSYLFVVNTRNGSLLSTASLPCSWTIDIKLKGPWITKNGTYWTLVCEYGDSVEVWTFHEGELLSPPEGKNLRDDVGFNLLFSRDSSSGSIDLAGDVTTTPDSLALSWADIVVMVTTQAPFHHLQKTWERRFLGHQGDYLPVTSLVFGHFTDSKENEVAVTVQDGTNMTIHILDTKNGSSVVSTNLGQGSVMSMERIPGEKDKTDTLVIESIHPTAQKVNSSRQPSEQTPRSYFTMRYIGKSAIYQALISSDVYASTLSQNTEGVADLLTASRTPEEHTSLNRIVITSPTETPFCNITNQRNTSTLLILN